MSFYVSTATFILLHCDEWDRVVALPRHKFVTGATLLQLGFTYFYPKPKVLADGVSTAPLEIWGERHTMYIVEERKKKDIRKTDIKKKRNQKDWYKCRVPVSINQSETRKKNQSEQGWLLLRPRSNYISIEKIVIGILDFFDRPIPCNVNIIKLWPRITFCWWTRRKWVKSWTNWFKTKSWTYFRWRHFRSKLYYYSSKKNNAGKNPGMHRTYFRSGSLPVTWLPDVTSGENAPLGRILRNFRSRMRITYFRTGHVTNVTSSHVTSGSTPAKATWDIPIYYHCL